KASRADVYAGLRERFEARPFHDPRALEDKRSELQRHRDLLRRYLALVRTPLGKLGLTAHALAWREIRLRQLFTREEATALAQRWSPIEPLGLERSMLSENRDLLRQYGQALLAVEAGQNSARTRWTFARRLDPFDQTKALEAAGNAERATSAL